MQTCRYGTKHTKHPDTALGGNRGLSRKFTAYVTLNSYLEWVSLRAQGPTDSISRHLSSPLPSANLICPRELLPLICLIPQQTYRLYMASSDRKLHQATNLNLQSHEGFLYSTISNGAPTATIALQHQQSAYRVDLPDFRLDNRRVLQPEAPHCRRKGHGILPLQQLQGRCSRAHKARPLHTRRERRERRLSRRNMRGTGCLWEGRDGGPP